MQIVSGRLRQDDVAENGCLLDGFPRTGPQAQMLAKSVAINRFILLQVPDEAVIERALGRLNDPATGAIYHLKYAPAPAEAVGRLFRRDNDASEEIVRNRLRVFHGELPSIAPQFEDRLVLVDGTKSIQEVSARL